MPKFVFWNLNRGALSRWVADLARQENADVIILAESTRPEVELLVELNAERSDYQLASGYCGHLLFFTRFHPGLFPTLIESHRISIRSLALPRRQPILIADAERHEGHQRTIVIGDLNMNPFESGMVAASGGLHAVMSRRVAARDTRRVHKDPYKFFYNPMWCHFGDRAEAAGTYYFESGEPLCYFWNIFDQVLLRPDLLDGFAHEQVRIVTEIDGRSLLKDGCPDRERASDHLPLVLELDF